MNTDSAFGPHLTIDAGGCNRAKLVSQLALYRFLDQLPARIGMTKMTLPYVVEWLDKWADTPGYSGFVMLAESHISLHTFPDSDYVFLDIFSCREFDVEGTKAMIQEFFEAEHITAHLVKRGLDFPKPQKVEVMTN